MIHASVEPSSFTPEQAGAIRASGNVLLIAGAGTGKTRTLVERCVQQVLQGKANLDEILMVTFTEAAAAEMRSRIRERLEREEHQRSGDSRVTEQLALLDQAAICTLHSFCFQLVREHFYQLELDPQLSVLTEQQARLLQEETFDSIFENAYAGTTPSAEETVRLIRLLGHGQDAKIRELVRQIHEYTQTRPDPEGWFARECAKLEKPNRELWLRWLFDGVQELCNSWTELLRVDSAECANLAACVEVLSQLPVCRTEKHLRAAFDKIRQIDDSDWKGKKGALRPAEFFRDVEFLNSLLRPGAEDPLLQDWQWSAPSLRALLDLAEEFAHRFGAARRAIGAIDFHDLEQFSLRLLWSGDRATDLAAEWQQRFKFVFVDEYQDINPAQDQILRALGRPGEAANRFMVGDVKQSIYRFRQADPGIFQSYAAKWSKGYEGTALRLSENFRSREQLLVFINDLFGSLMQPELGGIDYEAEGQLVFGDRERRAHLAIAQESTPRVEVLLSLNGNNNDEEDERTNAEREASAVAMRLKEIRHAETMLWDGEKNALRKADWKDMVILLRAPAGKVEAYAREFDRAGIPLSAGRGGLLETLEVQDLLNLLLILDNPLQDRPLLAVLRSPFAGLTADELVKIRLAARNAEYWTALELWHRSNSKQSGPTCDKVSRFLERFRRWRTEARCSSVTQLVERILEETHYSDWLTAQTRPRQRSAHVQQFLAVTREFDNLHGQGIYRFLQFVEAEQDSSAEREPPPLETRDAVRLMTIHKSKGLEFPIVVVPDLGKQFNQADVQKEIILDDLFGLCARVHPPESGRSYPSLGFWLAKRKQIAQSLAEELRLLYVAMTRAQEMLILSGLCSDKKAEAWANRKTDHANPSWLQRARSCFEWLGPWFAARAPFEDWLQTNEGMAASWRWRIIRGSDRINPLEDALPTPQESVLSAGSVQQLLARLQWTYPHTEATKQAAKASVTVLRREAAEEAEADTPFGATPPRFVIDREKGQGNAVDIGVAHHLFLQSVDLLKVAQPNGCDEELKRLVAAGLLSKDQSTLVDLTAVSAFWSSDLGKRILSHSGSIQREVPFTVRLDRTSDAEIPLLSRIPEGEFIIVQGVVDLAVLLPNEIWIVDFKTDKISSSEAEEKAREYAVQLKLYARALSQIYKKPVTHQWLHFLKPGRSVEIPTVSNTNVKT